MGCRRLWLRFPEGGAWGGCGRTGRRLSLPPSSPASSPKRGCPPLPALQSQGLAHPRLVTATWHGPRLVRARGCCRGVGQKKGRSGCWSRLQPVPVGLVLTLWLNGGGGGAHQEGVSPPQPLSRPPSPAVCPAARPPGAEGVDELVPVVGADLLALPVASRRVVLGSEPRYYYF